MLIVNGNKKGKAFECRIAKDCRGVGLYHAKTKREARGGDFSNTDDGIDLVNTEPFLIQCKDYAAYKSVNTIEEVDIQSVLSGWDHKTDPIPVLVTNALRKPTMAVVKWDDLLWLMGVYLDKNEN